jgi:hypothetical protein
MSLLKETAAARRTLGYAQQRASQRRVLMSSKMLVRGAAVSGIVVCALAGGMGMASAADPTACLNGATNYPDCTTTGGGGATGGGGPVTVATGSGTTTGGGSASSLPFTGFEAGAAAAIGIAAVGAGTIFIVASRRRRSSGDSAAA